MTSKKIKGVFKKNFRHFFFFFNYLRLRIFVSLGLSLLVGTLDGIGIAMFLPLLQMVDGESTVNAESMGNLRFLLDWMNDLGIGVTLVSVLLVLLFFFVLKGLFRFGEAYYKLILTRYFVKSLRFSNIDGLSNYSYKAFVTADVGRIQNTLSGEVAKVLQAYRNYFLSVQSAIMVFVYVVLAVLANAQFAILVTAGAMLSNLVYQRIYKKTKEASKKITRRGHRFQALLMQKVHFFKYLKATGLMHSYARKLKDVVLDTEKISLKMGWYNAILSSTKEPLVVMVVIGVVIIQVTYFSQSIGLIVLSLLFFYRSLNFLMNLQLHWNTFLQSSGSLDNMREFTRDLKKGEEKTGAIPLESFRHSLELKNASFSYGSRKILSTFNITIKKNETVAFVGESGSGKTTLVNLLAGLIHVNSGQFLIDGTDAREMDLRSYQHRIGYITQEPVIFSDSIFNNVTFWAEPTAENKIKFWEAVKKASIDEFILTLENQENSLLGNNGILVSGGQKQRLSIARELYKNVDILMMDEATSSLDSETEKVIQQNIEQLKGRYTILIVAHRLATIKNADKVVVMNNGKILATGTFEELKSTSRVFERMVELQEI
jgi:ABC-type multidrug transport system fused ATPase/permease subunit